MSRLQSELQRLYGPEAGNARGLVLELAGPGAWEVLGRVWRGVQSELELPAPGIAVSGTDGLQLWFSLAQAVAPAAASAFLEALRARYLPDVPSGRVRAWARIDGGDAAPPTQVAPERWSAFIASDLAPLFSGEPWLDHPPGADAQADLLSRLSPTRTDAFEQACARLADVPVPGPAVPPAAGVAQDPRQFLQGVMNDAQAPLALRIEAAKALLPKR